MESRILVARMDSPGDDHLHRGSNTEYVSHLLRCYSYSEYTGDMESASYKHLLGVDQYRDRLGGSSFSFVKCSVGNESIRKVIQS